MFNNLYNVSKEKENMANLITTQQALLYLAEKDEKLSKMTSAMLRYYTNTGRIRGTRLGIQLFYQTRDLDKFIEWYRDKDN